MTEFGKRRSAQGAGGRHRPAAASADLGAAAEAVRTSRLPYWANIGPLRIVLVLLVAAGGYWWFILPYAADLVRDHRLAGTWQPAYDMQISEAKCTRYNYVFTTCSAKIKSLPRPDTAPLAIGFVMAFSSGGGESVVPMRSTVDPSAVTIGYAAETKLMNRTLTFMGLTIGFAAMFLAALSARLRGRYAGGAAHRALLAGFEDLKARVGTAHADPRAGF